NSTDLFSLFAELAEVNLDEAVTDDRPIDAQPLLPYLVEPSSPAIRTVNYTEMGTNIKATNTEPPSPCVIPASNICVQLFPQQAVCADQGGTWYGPGGVAGPEGLSSCCAVNDYFLAQDHIAVDIMPESQSALRNATHKLVQLELINCSTMRLVTVDELYAIDEAIPDTRHDNSVYILITQTMLP